MTRYVSGVAEIQVGATTFVGRSHTEIARLIAFDHGWNSAATSCIASSSGADTAPGVRSGRYCSTAAKTRMRRLQLSIEAGVESAAVADALNRALEEREAARADLDRVPTTNVLTEKKIAEIIDGLGNVAELLNRADPSELAALYAALRLEMVYNAAAKIVGVSIRPTGRGSDRVRGGT